MTRQTLRRYMEEFSLSQNELSRRSGVSQPTISNFLSGVSELNEDNTEKLEKVMGSYGKLVYLLTIQKDGQVKYCHSYSKDIAPETIYWMGADDERMSIPYGFRSFKQAEWMFWQWKKLTGKTGWRFEVLERSV